MYVRPKKHLGQHFLKDKNIARKIADVFKEMPENATVLEVGPGTGMLTDFLFDSYKNLVLVEKDKESVRYLGNKYKDKSVRIIEGDFLEMDLKKISAGNPLYIIGNFPYNISSQIIFKILENKDLVEEMAGMFQKEVAERIVSPPGNKNYGILSVLTQTYYSPEYRFSVPPQVFHPPPKVQSGVIKLKRKKRKHEPDFDTYKILVKSAFNQRRKTLRNSLKSANLPVEKIDKEILVKRPEQIPVEMFEKIYNQINT